ncbi:hypothetical protein ABE438_17610 [Bosea sp. TWI1241]|uniref:hypothetical protein n=1 Tax=Bosea sp. TWI1241 TaxID=3148904 RepID=UPI00320B7D4F
MNAKIVDREQLASVMAQNRAMLEHRAGMPGQVGVSARLGLATFGADQWTADEVERGTADAHIVVAAIERAASIVSARTAGLTAEAREACIELLVDTVRRGHALIDALPADTRRAVEITTHAKQ